MSETPDARSTEPAPVAPVDASRSTSSLVESVKHTISRNYGPQPLVMARGEGMWLIDRDGRRFLDFVAGIAVSSLGHAHPQLVEALSDQVGKLLHVSNLYVTEPQALLQERLTELSFADRVFLCNSGAEANEAAIKLTRRFQQVVRGQDGRAEIVAATKSFHGRTLGAIAATGQPKYWKGFEPLPAGFSHVPFNDIEALDEAVGQKTAGVLLEPVQGEGGLVPASKEYLEAARRICDERGALLIFDEVQCGTGRLGTLWAHEVYGVTPDVMTLAKGIGAGVPLGAMVSTETVSKGFERGSHATTFGGNPLAARAGLTVLDVLTSPGFLERVRDVGEHLRSGLEALSERFELISDVRGRGLMMGVEVGTEHSKSLMLAACREGLLINTAGGIALRLVPPLIAEKGHVDEALRRLERAFERVVGAAH